VKGAGDAHREALVDQPAQFGLVALAVDQDGVAALRIGVAAFLVEVGQCGVDLPVRAAVLDAVLVQLGVLQVGAALDVADRDVADLVGLQRTGGGVGDVGDEAPRRAVRQADVVGVGAAGVAVPVRLAVAVRIADQAAVGGMRLVRRAHVEVVETVAQQQVPLAPVDVGHDERAAVSTL